MNLGNVVALDRDAETAILLVADGDQLFRVSLRPVEVRAISLAIGPGDRVSIEILRAREGLRLIIGRARTILSPRRRTGPPRRLLF
jgi:hypothetical protein